MDLLQTLRTNVASSRAPFDLFEITEKDDFPGNGVDLCKVQWAGSRDPFQGLVTNQARLREDRDARTALAYLNLFRNALFLHPWGGYVLCLFEQDERVYDSLRRSTERSLGPGISNLIHQGIVDLVPGLDPRATIEEDEIPPSHLCRELGGASGFDSPGLASQRRDSPDAPPSVHQWDLVGSSFEAKLEAMIASLGMWMDLFRPHGSKIGFDGPIELYPEWNIGIQDWPGQWECEHIDRHPTDAIRSRCDVLILSRSYGSFRRSDAERVQATIILEASDFAIHPDAYPVLEQKGVVVVPDLLCGLAGNVFDWALIIPQDPIVAKTQSILLTTTCYKIIHSFSTFLQMPSLRQCAYTIVSHLQDLNQNAPINAEVASHDFEVQYREAIGTVIFRMFQDTFRKEPPIQAEPRDPTSSLLRRIQDRINADPESYEFHKYTYRGKTMEITVRGHYCIICYQELDTNEAGQVDVHRLVEELYEDDITNMVAVGANAIAEDLRKERDFVYHYMDRAQLVPPSHRR